MTGVVRVGIDKHVGHAGVKVPYHQTSYATGSGDVFINGAAVVRQGDSTACGDVAVGCSGKVFVNGKGVHRIGDATSGHGPWVPNRASSGSGDVIAG